MIDSGDPNNYAQHLVVSETPTYLIEVVGNGAENRPDQVIPNGFANPLAALAQGKMALAGTEPLARLLGAVAVPAQTPGFALDGVGITRFNAGEHSSLLNPASSQAATAEMQYQIATFFISRGAQVGVQNPAVIAGQ